MSSTATATACSGAAQLRLRQIDPAAADQVAAIVFEAFAGIIQDRHGCPGEFPDDRARGEHGRGRSLALYASLGFEGARRPMNGRRRPGFAAGVRVRPLEEDDLGRVGSTVRRPGCGPA